MRKTAKREWKGIQLDLGCGPGKQPGFIGMDRRAQPGVDIVHDLHDTPWPLNDMSCTRVLFSHVMEHLDPMRMLDIFDEIWRVLEPKGQLLIAVPYANSQGGHQDPTHTRPGFLPQTFQYFDPTYPLYQIYKPKPYYIVGTPDIKVNEYINIILEAAKRNDGTPDIRRVVTAGDKEARSARGSRRK
jgi:SAM-dependent methyltransferase